jgi:hypothetical protein
MSNLENAFSKFDADNPHVYELFKKFTEQIVKAGAKTYSARAIIHRIRWHTDIDTESVDTFKINNNHSPYYARKYMSEFPSRAGMFRVREVT